MLPSESSCLPPMLFSYSHNGIHDRLLFYDGFFNCSLYNITRVASGAGGAEEALQLRLNLANNQASHSKSLLEVDEHIASQLCIWNR